MHTFYRSLFTFILTGLTLGLNSWLYGAAEEQSTWRRPHFARDNIAMNKNCNKICNRRNQVWTNKWTHHWLQGQRCECKPRPKMTTLLFGKEDKPTNIEHRPVGSFTSSQELHDTCTRICQEQGETYTGDWKYKAFRGYHCSCQKNTAQ